MVFSIGQADFYQGMHKMHNHMHHIIVRMHNAMGYRKLSMFLLGGFRDEATSPRCSRWKHGSEIGKL